MAILFFRKKYPLLLTCLAGLIIGLSVGCGPKKEELVLTKVAEKVIEFRLDQEAECREAMRREAEKIVDSLLLAEATGQLADSLSRMRPGRPAQPGDIPAIDSLNIQPIFPATSTQGN